MNLTDHFTLEELVFSSTAVRLGIDNTPPPLVVTHLRSLAEGLEQVRALLGGIPIHLDSGYRCPELNAVVHGVTNSAHLNGYAADFICVAYGTPLAICKAIDESAIRYDELIQEGQWVHVSFDPAMRHRLLTAHFGGGSSIYTTGLS
jgi:hypothetical protein